MHAAALKFAPTPAPVAELPGAADPAGWDVRAPEHLRDAPILVVDDEPATLALFRRLLGRAGYRDVTVVSDAREALAVVPELCPDLVLLDLWMPVVDGFQLMKELRGGSALTRDVPLLVLSGDERPETKRAALSCGATDFLGKPFDTLEALLRVRNLLEMRTLHRATLRESEARYRDLVESASDLIYEADARGRITYANPATLRTFGYSADELIGTRLIDLVDDGHRGAVRAFYGEQIAARTAESSREVAVRTRDGGERWVEQSLRLVESGGEVTGLRAIARDVTARREMERVKDEIVAVVSHELRTPLTSIRASLGLLTGGALASYPERANRMLQIATQNADRLARLVDDFLDLERMAAGKMAIEPRPFSLAELVRQAADWVRPAAEKAGVLLVARAPDTEWMLDPHRVGQVLLNLLSNAVKFSPAGGTVWVTSDVEGDRVRFAVRDLGRGIPANKLEAIFGRFEQVDSSDARQQGGSGLGLAICRSIVELHGGKIEVQSTLGHGSTFTFSLPNESALEERAGAVCAE